MLRRFTGLYALIILLLCYSCTPPVLQEKAIALNAIPGNAAFIIETGNHQSSFEKIKKAEYWNSIYQLDGFKEECDRFTQFDSLLKNQQIHFESDQSLFISAHITGAEQYNFLFATASKNQIAKLETFQQKIIQIGQQESRNYDGTQLFSVDCNEIDFQFSYALYKGVFLFSTQELLVRDAIRQLNSDHSLSNNPTFHLIYNTANKKDDANIFIQMNQLENFAGMFMKKKPNNIDVYGDWIALDIDFKENMLFLNGVTMTDDSLKTQLDLFKQNPPQHINTANIAPSNTALLIVESTENYRQYHRNYKKLLEKNNKLKKYEQQLAAYSIDVENAMIKWVDTEQALLLTDYNKLDEHVFAVFKATDKEECLQSLAPLSNNFSENYRSYHISQLAYPELIHTVYGERFSDIKNAYYTYIKGYIVYANSISNLRSFINDVLTSHTLSEKEYYKKATSKLASQSNLLVIIHNPAALSLAEKYLNKDWATKISKHKDQLSKFEIMALQMSATDDYFDTSFFCFYDDSQEQETRAIWAATLENGFSGRPHVVSNHYRKEKEVIVQDDKHQLYLIDHKGQILWQKDIDEKIIGDIRQIDIYGNNKWQYAFNTESKLFILDRNGAHVKGFPIAFKHRASAPMAIFDYEKNHKYRFLVPQGKTLHMYDKNGKEINGWKFNESSSLLTHQPTHFVVAQKDFILIPESNGTLNVTNRRGEARFLVEEKIDFSNNEIYLIKGKNLNESRLVTTDKSGQLYSIYFNGKIDRSSIGALSSEHFYAYYKDGMSISLNESELNVNHKETNFNHRFESDHFYNPKRYTSLLNGSLIALQANEESQVYIFTKDGRLLDDFPVYGTSDFDIGDLDNDGHLNLIVGSKEGSIYNYNIE